MEKLELKNISFRSKGMDRDEERKKESEGGKKGGEHSKGSESEQEKRKRQEAGRKGGQESEGGR